jgi:hypothetical protein
MCRRFKVIEGTAASHYNRPLRFSQRAHPPAFRTRLLFTQLASLLLGRGFQSPRQQATHGRDTDVFHLVQVDVQPRAAFAPSLPNDVFSPSLGHFLDSLEVFRRRFACAHVASLQQDPLVSPDEILP